ncbi:hypothetical protein M758_12G084800 [Ceratodon purpureus]|nr:hypothetical protein M758_12G084800 [Ceratodon purpureus]
MSILPSIMSITHLQTHSLTHSHCPTLTNLTNLATLTSHVNSPFSHVSLPMTMSFPPSQVREDSYTVRVFADFGVVLVVPGCAVKCFSITFGFSVWVDVTSDAGVSFLNDGVFVTVSVERVSGLLVRDSCCVPVSGFVESLCRGFFWFRVFFLLDFGF